MSLSNSYIRTPFFVVCAAAFIFFVIYIFTTMPISVPVDIGYRFDWPDETANYFWSVQYAEKNLLSYSEPLNEVAKNQIHPRSFNVREDGTVVPGSFLGLILLYGVIGKITGSLAIIYFTPFLGALSAVLLYGIVKQFFDKNCAMVSSLLLLIHPAWWYYSVTSMLPNVAFIFFVLLSVYFFIDKKNSLSYAFSGMALGVALGIRPSEFLWLVILYFGIFLMKKNILKLKNLLIFAVFTGILLTPVLYYQKQIYGSTISSGYDQLYQENVCQICTVITSLLLPFGFHPNTAISTYWENGVMLFWIFSLLTFAGILFMVYDKNQQKNTVIGYTVFSIFICGWLILYYGSWRFSDQMTVDLNRIGDSRIRYWLPVYIILLPFAAMSLLYFVKYFKKLQKHALIILLVGIGSFSAYQTLWANQDSIMPVKQRIIEYRLNAAAINQLTEENAVIITVRKDKVFFPQRKVIHTFTSLENNQELIEIVKSLKSVVPVYYYSLQETEQFDFAGELKLQYIQKIGAEMLYKIK